MMAQYAAGVKESQSSSSSPLLAVSTAALREAVDPGRAGLGRRTVSAASICEGGMLELELFLHVVFSRQTASSRVSKGPQGLEQDAHFGRHFAGLAEGLELLLEGPGFPRAGTGR